MKTEARRSVGGGYEMVRKTKRKEWIVKDFNEVGSTVCDQLIKYGR